MPILIRIILILTALSVGFGVFGAIGSCMGARNCESSLGESLSWAFLISAPFAISALTLNSRKKTKSIINLACLATVAAFVCFLFSSRTIPWNLISAITFITHGRDIDFLIFLVGIFPSILIHTSLFCMLCMAPKNIKTLKEQKNRHNLVADT